MVLKMNPTHRRGWWPLAMVAIVLISFGILSIPWRGHRPDEPPRLTLAGGSAGPLSAGVASRPLDPGPDPTIGGFPRFRWRAEGVRDPLSARALVLSAPGVSVALVSVELLLVPGALARAVRAQVADLGLDAVVVGATHTHAGLGGYWDSLPGELGATGPYQPETFERLVAALAGVVRDAHAARGPAALAVARGEAGALVRNRTGAEVDGRLLSLRFARPDGAPLAELVSFTAHPTLLGSRNRLLSGDWVARVLAEAPHGTRLFFQGPIGDQSVRLPPALAAAEAGVVGPRVPGGAGGAAAPVAPPVSISVADARADAAAPVDTYGRAVAAALTGLPAEPTQVAPRLGVAAAAVGLPDTRLGAVPAFLEPATRTLLGGLFPDQGGATAVSLGDTVLVFTPSEPVEGVARAWRAAVGPAVRVELFSLADDYVGYVDTAARFTVGDGEARRSYYGPALADRLQGAVVAAARAARGAADGAPEGAAAPGGATGSVGPAGATGSAGAAAAGAAGQPAR